MSRQKYLRNHELRQEIVYAVGGDPPRYYKDEPVEESGPKLRKSDIIDVAQSLQPEENDVDLQSLSLQSLYELVCRCAGCEYEPNAGRPWGFNRDELKQIHEAVDGRPPDEDIEVRADGGGFDEYYPPPDASSRRQPDRVDPENACIECSDRGTLRCGCCGFPLCGRHHKTGGGFCTRRTMIGGVSVCVYRHTSTSEPSPARRPFCSPIPATTRSTIPLTKRVVTTSPANPPRAQLAR